MRAPSLSLLAVLLLCLPSASNARIGETLQQCIARYGQPDSGPEESLSHPKATECVFIKGGFDISVIFWAGKAASIMFSKLDRSAFSSAEVEELLGKNGGGWMLLKANERRRNELPNATDNPNPDEYLRESDSQVWETADGKADASLNSSRDGKPARTFFIETTEWFMVMCEREKELEQEEKSEAKKNLEGL